MADVLKFGRKATARGEEIPAALREFIDAVVIPALVKECLAETENPNVLVLSDDGMANSATRELPSEGVLR